MLDRRLESSVDSARYTDSSNRFALVVGSGFDEFYRTVPVLFARLKYFARTDRCKVLAFETKSTVSCVAVATVAPVNLNRNKSRTRISSAVVAGGIVEFHSGSCLRTCQTAWPQSSTPFAVSAAVVSRRDESTEFLHRES